MRGGGSHEEEWRRKKIGENDRMHVGKEEGSHLSLYVVVLCIINTHACAYTVKKSSHNYFIAKALDIHMFHLIFIIFLSQHIFKR